MSGLHALTDASTRGVAEITGPIRQLDAPERMLCFVVDDEPAIFQTIACVLRPQGIDVASFSDSGSLLEALRGRSPSLIFLDLALQRSDAVDAIRALASMRFSGAVQLISGSPDELLDEVRKIGERYGLKMLPVLSKPFSLDALTSIVHAEPWRKAPPEQICGLGEALDRGWVELWYQPKIDLRNSRLAGAEALARVRHPEFGVLPPSAFLPGAPTSEFLALAEFSLITAMRDMDAFSEYGSGFQIAVNIPVDVLQSLSLPSLIREHGPDGRGERLIIEVTEDQFVRDIALAKEISTQLRICGITLSIDDFGAGYSSLARMKEFRFGELKFDRALVGNCASDELNAGLCQTAIELAHRFNCTAVAEGIESIDDLQALQKMGCDIGQGFVFAKAMPKEEFVIQLCHSGRKTSWASLTERTN